MQVNTEWPAFERIHAGLGFREKLFLGSECQRPNPGALGWEKRRLLDNYPSPFVTLVLLPRRSGFSELLLLAEQTLCPPG